MIMMKNNNNNTGFNKQIQQPVPKIYMVLASQHTLHDIDFDFCPFKKTYIIENHP